MKSKIYAGAIDELNALLEKHNDLNGRNKLRDTAFAIIKRSGDESMANDFKINASVNSSRTEDVDFASIRDAIDIAIEEFRTMLKNQEIIEAAPPKVTTTTTKTTTTTTKTGANPGYIGLGYFFTFLIAGISGGYAVGTSVGGNRYDKEKFELASQNENLLRERESLETKCENRFMDLRRLKETAEEKLVKTQEELSILRLSKSKKK